MKKWLEEGVDIHGKTLMILGRLNSFFDKNNRKNYIEVNIDSMKILETLKEEFEACEHIDRVQASKFTATENFIHRPFESVFDCTDFLAEVKRMDEDRNRVREERMSKRPT